MFTGSFHEQEEPELMLDINTTPLIDVMLVLLVMLIITIPIHLHAVDLAMPVGTAAPNPAIVEKIQIDIDARGQVSWLGQPIDAIALEAQLHAQAQRPVQPEIHVRPDRNAQYAVFAHVLAATRRQGLTRVAVIGHEQFAGPGRQ
jgi:biopolymer transport protein ExbD